MKCTHKTGPPIVFADRTVFLASTVIPLDKKSTDWRIPGEYESEFLHIATLLTEDNCLDQGFLNDAAHLLEKALESKRGTINWRRATTYEYLDTTPPDQSVIPTLSNQVDTLPQDIKKTEFLQRYSKYKWSTCHIEDNEIVSLCYANNRVVGIETNPKYRKKGFGTACLIRITSDLVRADLRPAYGTPYDNVASRKAAEAAGYTLIDYQYWIEIPKEQSEYISDKMKSIIDSASKRKK